MFMAAFGAYGGFQVNVEGEQGTTLSFYGIGTAGRRR
jgi:hypothetical protein